MGFKQTVTRVDNSSAEKRAEQKAAIKAAFSGYKNPFASQNPFKDNQDLTFEGLVEVAWSHEKWGSGKYLALSFVGIEPTISLSSFLKEAEGYSAFEIKDSDIAKTFTNEGGFADWLKNQEWNDTLIDKIEEYFANLTTPNKVAVKLTKYYIPMGSSRKASTLTNLI